MSERLLQMVIERCAQCPFSQWEENAVAQGPDGSLACHNVEPIRCISDYPNPSEIPEWCPLAKLAYPRSGG